MTRQNGRIDRIIAVKTHALGDVLMLTPALRALREHFRDARIDFLTGSWSAEALRNNPDIDNLIEIPDEVFHQRRISGLLKVILSLRIRRYQLGVLFQPAVSLQWVLRFAGISDLAGPAYPGKTSHLKHSVPWRQDRNRYVAEDFMDVVRSLGVVSSNLQIRFEPGVSAVERIDKMTQADNLGKGNFIVVCPGGARNPRDFVRQKLWPVERFRDLIIKLRDSGISVVATGSSKDREILKPLLDLKGISNWIGRTTFEELGALMRIARVVVTNDSAPMHLALAVGCPFVAIFGPSRHQALLPPQGNYQVVNADISCAPCYDNEPFGQCVRMDCIESVQCEQVIESVMKAWKTWEKPVINHD